MLDCYMAWDVEFTLRMAEALRPARPRWIEECLPPDDYEGYAEITRKVEGMAVATGEHEYTRWGFGELLSRRCCHIVQPDLSWCGGISEARKIAALAGAHGVPVIPHAGGLQPWGIHWLAAQATMPWAEYVVIANRSDGALRPLFPFLRGVPQPPGWLPGTRRRAWPWYRRGCRLAGIMRIQRITMSAPRQAALEEADLSEASLAPTEVLLRTQVSAISPGTELAYYAGDRTLGHRSDPYPFYPGYAAVGEVLAAGDEAPVRVGDLVLAQTPHQSAARFDSRQRLCVRVPEGVAPESATLARLAQVAR